MALQSLVTRRFDVFDPVIVTVGLFQAGTWPHVIPDSAHFEASVRSFSTEAHTRVCEESVQVCQRVAAAHGLRVDAEVSALYPVTVNDYQETEFASSVIRDTFGENRFRLLSHPLPPAEDFSRVLDIIPGTYIILGACPSTLNPATAPGNHSSGAIFDESVILDGARLYAELAERRLRRAQNTTSTEP